MLELKDLSFTITENKSSRKILGNISLCIKCGALTVITGPNGSGKSTLAELIMGIKNPTAGQIILDKKDITTTTITDRANLGVAFSFQQPVKFKGLNVYDLLNIANGELINPKEANQYLKKVGLDPADYLLREVNDKLSGGELKRIEIATILARKNTKIIIFDEPEAGIDLWSFTKLIQIFQSLKKQGKTLIIISHQEKILKIADEIIILENGQIKAQGAPTVILSKLKEAKA